MKDWEDNEPNETPEEHDADVLRAEGYEACLTDQKKLQAESDHLTDARIDGMREAMVRLPEMIRDQLPKSPEVRHLMSLAAFAEVDPEWTVATLLALAKRYKGFETAVVTTTVHLMLEQEESPRGQQNAA